MTPNLTAPNQELDRLIRQTPSGMMNWSGTSSDPAATCGGCIHFGYEDAVRNFVNNVVETHEYPSRCALYRKHTGHHSKPFNQKTPACKYFEARQTDEA